MNFPPSQNGYLSALIIASFWISKVCLASMKSNAILLFFVGLIQLN